MSDDDWETDADFVNDLRRALEPAAAALALCLYEMACGFELDGLPPVLPPSCPATVRETLEVLLRSPSPKEKRPPRTLEDALELPLFIGSGSGVASHGVVAAAPPPLPDEMLQHARQLTNGRGEPNRPGHATRT